MWTPAKYTTLSLLLCGLLLLAGCTDGFSSFDDAADDEHVQGEKFRHGHLLDRATRAISHGKDGSTEQLQLVFAVSPQKIMERYSILERYKIMERYRVFERYQYSQVFPGYAISVEDTTGSNDFDAFIAALASDPDIAWFEPDFSVATPNANASGGANGQQIPWSVALIGGQDSPAQSGDGQGNVPVDLYVLDTGVAKADNGDPDDDLDLVESIDFRGAHATGSAAGDAKDYDGHGTHIAGIAAAVDDGDGVVGVAPGAHVHNLKVLNENGLTDVSVVLAAIEHILEQKQANPATPMVVNMSLGEDVETSSYTALDEAIKAATQAGVVFVVAAGNHGKNASGVTPAHTTEAITVGAYDFDGRFSSFSNYGPKVDLLAPGDGIISLSKDGAGTPVEMSGTSMAAAHVSGAALLYLWQHPNASPSQVKQALLDQAAPFVTDTPSGTTNKSVWVGPAGSAPVTGGTVEVRIGSGNDDAEERANGSMYLDSSDLELTEDGGGYQTVGLRFTGLGIPQGATIERAYVQFKTDETDSESTSLTIRAHRAGNANAFSSSDDNLSNRPTTSASAAWQPGAWSTVGQAGSAQRTPELKAVIQEIVSRQDWQSGNALALLITGTGERTAESREGDANGAPLLHVEWSLGTAPPPPPPAAGGTVEVRIGSDNDDAEERANGSMYLDSSDLELTEDGGGYQTVGLRFTGLGIPQGATIERAYVQFKTDETDSESTSLTIRAHRAGNANAFSSSDDNLSNRPTTSASAAWQPGAWSTVGQAGSAQRTPELKAVIQEIVSRQDWQSGNALALLITGTGERTAESREGDANGAPLLHIEWSE